MALVHVSELPPQRLDEARGLVRACSPANEPVWRQWLAGGSEAGRGTLCATALNGVLLGLAAYWVEPRSPGVPILRVDLFLAFELGGRCRTALALREALGRLSADLDCGAVIFARESPGLMAPA